MMLPVSRSRGVSLPVRHRTTYNYSSYRFSLDYVLYDWAPVGGTSEIPATCTLYLYRYAFLLVL